MIYDGEFYIKEEEDNLYVYTHTLTHRDGWTDRQMDGYLVFSTLDAT